jgi:hypothetical protein
VKYPENSMKLTLHERELTWLRKREEKGIKKNQMNKEFPGGKNEFPEWDKENDKKK